jgi:hypothetical protein
MNERRRCSTRYGVGDGSNTGFLWIGKSYGLYNNDEYNHMKINAIPNGIALV